MKKIICCLLSLVLICSSLIACNLINTDAAKFDVWDGDIAKEFSNGDGSESAPYQISSCAELAYLAKEVNNGNSFSGKYFVLSSDLDLNKLEWTPIGNGVNHFSGYFDGDDHTIKNLKITNPCTYEVPVLDSSFTECVIGLFGSCLNSTLKNLKIDMAEITMKDISGTSIYSGILVGYMQSKEGSQISNIKIINSKTISDNSKTVSLLIGGVAGRISNKSIMEADRLETELSVMIKSGAAQENIIGGLVGGLGNSSSSSSLEIKDCVSSISISTDEENYFLSNNLFGSIGSCTNACSLSNIFSKVAVNKIYGYLNGRPAYTANAIIGKVYIGSNYKDNLTDKYQFKNLFGYVEQTDGETGEKATSTQLYDIPEECGDVVSEENCLGCTSLPKDHGLPTDIWNLKDPSSPKLK